MNAQTLRSIRLVFPLLAASLFFAGLAQEGTIRGIAWIIAFPLAAAWLAALFAEGDRGSN